MYYISLESLIFWDPIDNSHYTTKFITLESDSKCSKIIAAAEKKIRKMVFLFASITILILVIFTFRKCHQSNKPLCNYVTRKITSMYRLIVSAKLGDGNFSWIKLKKSFSNTCYYLFADIQMTGLKFKLFSSKYLNCLVVLGALLS